MKRKFLLVLFCGLLVLGGMSGCSAKASDAEQNSSGNDREMFEHNTKTAEESAAIEAAAQIEIEPLKLITSWEDKAVITLGSTITIQGSGAAAEGSIVSITEGGAYELTGTLSDGMIYVEADADVKLILNGVDITNSGGPAIYVYDACNAYIELADGTENVLTDGAEYTGVFAQDSDASESEVGKAALFSNDDLVFTGTGSLNVKGNYKHAVCSDDMVYFENGTITLSAVKDGVHVNDGICVDGGDIKVLTAHDGMESEGAFTVNGGAITIAAEDDGLTTLGNMEINGGSITVTACEEGLEAKNNLVVNDGTIEVAGNDDGLNGGSLVEMNGGFVYTDISNGDGVDSNGDLRLNGGIMVALGAQEPEGGADCDENTFTITGGTLIATGGTNSSPTEDSCTQVSVLLGSASNGDSVAIQDGNGNVVFAFAVSKQYSNMLLSTASVKSGEEYSVYTGGTISGAETFHGYYENASYSGGSESISFTADSMVVNAGGTAGTMGGKGRGGMGQRPGEGQMPGDGELPDGSEFPGNGELPDGSEFPENGEKPEKGKQPGNGELP